VVSAGPSARLAAHRAFLRAMRRTDLCHLTSSYEHPCLTGSRSVASFRARFPGDRLPSRQSDSLRRAAPGSICITSAGVVFPSRCVRPSLWHPCRVSQEKQPRSRESRRPESCRGHRPHARVKGVTCGVMARDVFRPTRTVAPRRPLERPAPDFALTAAWPPHRAQSAPFHPRGPLRASAGQAPVHASRCRRECASLGLGDARRLLQPDIDARARPRASRSSHASGAFGAPLLADKSPCRLRRPSPRVAAWRGLRATTSSTCVSTARSTCVGHAGRGPTRRSKGWHLPRTASGALLAALRAPGSPARRGGRVGARSPAGVPA
jgi:hypothetical protein